MKNKLLILTFVAGFYYNVAAQDELMDMFKENEPETELVTASFKGTKIVLGQSIENPAKGVLEFAIEHNFGKINQGAYEMWGLDQSTVRLGFKYGITKRLSVGLGRSSYGKTYDGSLKFKILSQSKGSKNVPLTISFYSAAELRSLKFPDDGIDYKFGHRMSYVSQLLIARKFSGALSLQLTPAYVHRNLTQSSVDKNDVFSLGFGGRFKLNQRISMNFEYFHLFSDQVAGNAVSPLSFGCDIDTGGHIFQLRLSNSQPMFDSGFISNTVDKWTEGGIFFGFTINRVFTIVKPEI